MHAVPSSRPGFAVPLERTLVRPLGWLAAGAAVGFAVPYVFTSRLDINHDLYYLIYFAVTSAFLAAYVVANHIDVAAMLGRHWKLSTFIGLAAAAFVVSAVLLREDGTDRPGGLYFVFSVFWRGLTYGLVDAALLSAFPAMVAFQVLHERVAGLQRRIAFAALTIAFSMLITATYHLGYAQFRDDGVRAPETGNTIISLPAALTTNPLGSFIAHAAMHVTADIHAYETETYLPPATQAE